MIESAFWRADQAKKWKMLYSCVIIRGMEGYQAAGNTLELTLFFSLNSQTNPFC